METWYKLTVYSDEISEVKAEAVGTQSIRFSNGRLERRKTQGYEYHETRQEAILSAKEGVLLQIKYAQGKLAKLQERLKKIEAL